MHLTLEKRLKINEASIRLKEWQNNLEEISKKEILKPRNNINEIEIEKAIDRIDKTKTQNLLKY